MVLDVRRALQAGYEDLTSTAGLNVFSVLLVFNFVSWVVVASFRQRLIEFVRLGEPVPFTVVFVDVPLGWNALLFDLPLAVLAVLAVGTVLTAELIRFWAIRQFADLSIASVPDLRERLPVLLGVGGGFALVLFGLRRVLPAVWARQGFEQMALAAQVAGVVGLVLVGITVYLRQEIALTDAGPRRTVRDSVRRFLAEPVPILGLLVLLGLLGVLSSLPAVVAEYAAAAAGVGGPVGTGSGAPVVPVAEVVGVVLGAALSTFSIAAITDAYVQTRGGKFR